VHKQTVRYALIGAGMGAETHAAELRHVDGAQLDAVYARDSPKAEEFRARYGARKAYTDRDALLADPEIDDPQTAARKRLSGRRVDYCIQYARHELIW
jgi:ornithine cyclodeaminase/alanine dehydrogenase-like protein (mu-crystallin family)